MGHGSIRIAYIIGTLDVGGAESQLVALARGLDPRRFSPSVYCLSHEGELAAQLRTSGVPVTSLGLRGLRIHRTPLKVARRVMPLFSMLARERPHVVHGFLYHAYVAGAVAGRLAGARAIVAGRRSLSHFKANRPFLRLAEGAANRLTDVIVANSEAVRQDAIRTEGLPPHKVMVIHNGLNTARYLDEAPNELRRELKLEGRCPIVLSVANFIHYKGHRFLLDAWRTVSSHFPSAMLLLAGDGPLRAAIESQISDLGLGDSVRLLGVRSDVPDLLALANVVVHPSLEEGFCNAILEAMAAGKAVVATKVGGNAEAIVEGETGLLVAPGDARAIAEALDTVMTDEEFSRRLGQAGRRRAQDMFDLDAMVRRYEGLYEGLLAQRAPKVSSR